MPWRLNDDILSVRFSARGQRLETFVCAFIREHCPDEHNLNKLDVFSSTIKTKQVRWSQCRQREKVVVCIFHRGECPFKLSRNQMVPLKRFHVWPYWLTMTVFNGSAKTKKTYPLRTYLFATKRNKRSSDLPSGIDRKDKSHYRPTKWVLRSFDSLLYLLIFKHKCNLSQVSLGLIVS